jgi:hypothetical protein
VGIASQVTKHDRRPITVGETVNLAQKVIQEVVVSAGGLLGMLGRIRRLDRLFAGSATSGIPRQSLSDPGSDAVEPRGEIRAPGHTRAPSREDQKSGLKRVVRIMLITEDPPANREHGRGMSLEEAAERRLIAMGKEAVEQLSVRETEQCAIVEQSIERGGGSKRVVLELVC